MKKVIALVLLLLIIIVGETYFREPFTVIWAVIGVILFVLLLIYQFIPNKHKPNKEP